MKKIVLLSFLSGLFLIVLLGGCFLAAPTVKVINLIDNFKKHWEGENPTALAALYTDPARINTAVKSYDKIMNTYEGLFSGRDVVSFNFIGDKSINLNASLTEGDVQFTAVIDYNLGPDDNKVYVWKVKKIGTKWLIAVANNY